MALLFWVFAALVVFVSHCASRRSDRRAFRRKCVVAFEQAIAQGRTDAAYDRFRKDMAVAAGRPYADPWPLHQTFRLSAPRPLRRSA
jgi:hypothetical protein